MSRVLLAGLLVCLCGQVQADWALVAGESTLAFTSTKNETITEVHAFRSLQGQVGEDGLGELTIDLMSVDTMIPIRDDRMRSFLFDSAPRARFVVELPLAAIRAQLNDGAARAVLAGKLEINGGTTDIEVPVIVLSLADGNVQVLGGGALDVAPLGYGGGIERLREIAGLTVISPETSFTFSLVWTPAE